MKENKVIEVVFYVIVVFSVDVDDKVGVGLYLFLKYWNLYFYFVGRMIVLLNLCVFVCILCFFILFWID